MLNAYVWWKIFVSQERLSFIYRLQSTNLFRSISITLSIYRNVWFAGGIKGSPRVRGWNRGITSGSRVESGDHLGFAGGIWGSPRIRGWNQGITSDSRVESRDHLRFAGGIKGSPQKVEYEL